KSTRFGEDKALSLINGEPLISRIILKLQRVSTGIYVVGNKEKYSFLDDLKVKDDLEVIEDIVPNGGPLVGLYTGLKHSNSRYNFVMGCDMPMLTAAYFQFVINYQRNYDVLVPENKGYIEPLAGVYSKSCLNYIYRAIKDSNLKVKAFFPEVKVEIIKEELIRKIADPAELFYNINYKKDLQKIKDII
ncbi:MAG TPA: molybdenum cofactor guanylyltransferase, partial [Halanaerobiales bacterium]|nr:molybdenum cofactor guanylyltransferase [Halanaerobiales bacterium]